MTDARTEAAARALYEDDAARSHMQSTPVIWERVRPAYVRRARVALEAADSVTLQTTGASDA